MEVLEERSGPKRVLGKVQEARTEGGGERNGPDALRDAELSRPPVLHEQRPCRLSWPEARASSCAKTTSSFS